MRLNDPATPGAAGKYGVAMVVLAWITALGIATAYFNEWLEERENPNRIVHGKVAADGVREIVLERNPQGHYVANGHINGQMVRFMVDTGATNLGIPAAVAQRLNLERGITGHSQTAAGKVKVYLLSLDSVSLGNIEQFEVRASVIPAMPGEEVLLGMSFLKDLEIIQKNNTLTLRQL
ncbi:MAG: aspartyl protease family protein [Halieaceae bacterium]|jgi:aspartyl protease family protein